MVSRLAALFIVISITSVCFKSGIFGISPEITPTLVLGIILLSGYCAGYILEQVQLPRITGYLIVGIVFGPFVLGFYKAENIAELSFLNSLALAFIAFCAGGEVRLKDIRPRAKSIIFLITGVAVCTFSGITLVVFIISSSMPVFSCYSQIQRLAIASIFGVISVARSPSSAIAIISETNARGDYTETVLTTTIAIDVLIIILFAVIMSICSSSFTNSAATDHSLLLYLFFEIVTAIIAGFLLGKAIIYLIERIHLEFPVVIAAMGYVVIKFCHLLGFYFDEIYNISVNIEPLLICMAAGFTVQNFSQHGKKFIHKMDMVSLPIYVAFFTIIGASLNVDIVISFWKLGLVIVITRCCMLFIGSFISGKLAGDPPRIYKYSWLGFFTQAGVSIGLLTEVVRRFPDFGIHIQNILIAAIAVNQLIGPIAFKYGLRKAGEVRKNILA